MTSKLGLSGGEIGKKGYYLLLLLLFIMLGLSLGVLPGIQSPTLEASTFLVGTAGELFRNGTGNGYNHFTSSAFPYGANVSEGYLLLWLAKLFLVFGFSWKVVPSIIYFLVFSLSYISLVRLLEKITGKNILAVPVCAALFYLDPFLRSEGGLPTIYLGNLYIPVVALADYYCYLILKRITHLETSRSVKFLLYSFIVKLLATMTGWYTPVISACTTCLFLLAFTLYRRIYKRDRLAPVHYIVFCLLPWILAMTTVYLMTPKSVLSYQSPLDFYNGNSVDIMTLFLPSRVQAISRVLPSVTSVLNGRVMAGAADSHYSYLGYAMVVALVIIVFRKKYRSVETICIGIVFCAGLILALGPGLKLFSIIDAENGVINYSYYLYPMSNVVRFPWAEVFTHVFPLTSMRAVYRWMLMPKFTLVISMAIFLSKAGNGESSLYGKYIIAAVALLAFAPNFGSIKAFKNVEMIDKFDREAIAELKEAKEELGVKEGERAIFLCYDLDQNAFLEPLLNSTLGTISYTGCVDKSIGTAYPYRPEVISNLQTAYDPSALSSLITRAAQYRICDYVIFPYFALREQSYFWPASENTENHCKNISHQVWDRLADSGFSFYESPHYFILDIREKQQRGEIKAGSALMDIGNTYVTMLEPAETDDFLYLYAFAERMEAMDDADDRINFRINAGEEGLLRELTVTFPADTNFLAIEKEIELPKNAKGLEVTIDPDVDGRISLRNITVSAVDSNAIYKSQEELELEEQGFKNAINALNVNIDDGYAHFNGDSLICITSTVDDPLTYLSISMDCRVEDQSFQNSGGTLLTKFNYWGNDMTVTCGFKNEKSYSIVSGDGNSASAIWYDNSLLNDGGWHRFSYEFDHGKATLTIDDTIFSKEFPFYQLYNVPGTSYIIGEGFVGDIRNFSLSYY